MQEYPVNLSYTREHMWARVETDETTVVVGITEDLAESLDEILSIDMPMPGDELDMETICIHVHLRQSIHHLRSPLSGRVLEINRDVLDNPNLLHLAPYAHWLYKMEYDEPEELHLLMSSAQYARFLDQL